MTSLRNKFLLDDIASLTAFPKSTKNILLELSLKLHLVGHVYDVSIPSNNSTEIQLKKKFLLDIVDTLTADFDYEVVKKVIEGLSVQKKEKQFSAAYAMNEILYQVAEAKEYCNEVKIMIQSFRLELLVSISNFSALTLTGPNANHDFYIAGLGSLFELKDSSVSTIVDTSFVVGR